MFTVCHNQATIIDLTSAFINFGKKNNGKELEQVLSIFFSEVFKKSLIEKHDYKVNDFINKLIKKSEIFESMPSEIRDIKLLAKKQNELFNIKNKENFLEKNKNFTLHTKLDQVF